MRKDLSDSRVWLRIVVGLLVLVVVGCGGGSSDNFVSTGTTTNTTTTTTANATGTTGALTFQFTQAQTATVPTGTTTLLFEFLNSQGAVVFTTEVDFAATVTISDVPVSAVDVNITALDGEGIPVATIEQEVTVVADAVSEVSLETAVVTVVVVSSISVTPGTSNLGVGDTVNLVGTATLSDGSTVALSPSRFIFSSSDTDVATVSTSGVVSAEDAGSTTVQVALAADASLQPVSVTINVSKIVIQSIFEGQPYLTISNGSGQTGGLFRLRLSDSQGGESVVDADDPDADITIVTTATGLSVVNRTFQNDIVFTIQAENSNIAPNDTFTVEVEYTDSDGVVLKDSVVVSVIDGQSA